MTAIFVPLPGDIKQPTALCHHVSLLQVLRVRSRATGGRLSSPRDDSKWEQPGQPLVPLGVNKSLSGSPPETL